MIISHGRRFVVLRNRKCASTALVNMLRPYADVHWDNCEAEMRVEYGIVRHASALECRRLFTRLGWSFEDYHVVASIRNPWERAVSAFHYERDVVKNEKLAGWTFRDYLHSRIFESWAARNDFAAFACDEEGRSLVGSLLRVESLGDDLRRVCAGLGVTPVDPGRRLNVTEHRPYRDYYTDDLVARVGDRLAADVRAGGYAF